MSVTIGIHRVTSQVELTNLMEAALAENKRVIVTLGRHGREVRVQPKDGRLVELFRNLTGQVQRESQRLRTYRDALPVAILEPDSAQAEVGRALQQAVHPQAKQALPLAPNDPHLPRVAGAQESAPALASEPTDSIEQNPQLYEQDPPFGTGGVVNGHYVQRQFGDCCFAHAMAAYFGKPVFQSEGDFLTFRNQSYDKVFGPIFFDDAQSLEAMKGSRLSETNAVLDVVMRLSEDERMRDAGASKAPWSKAVFGLSSSPGKAASYLAVENRPQAAAMIDGVFEHLATVSQSKRFIVRCGGPQGHYQTLVFDPKKNPGAPWTLLNSSKDPDITARLPTVKSGASPAVLLNALGTRELTLGIWTQSTDASASVEYGFLDEWQPPVAKADRFETSQDDGLDLPPPILDTRWQAPSPPGSPSVEVALPPPILTSLQPTDAASTAPVQRWDFSEQDMARLEAQVTEALLATRTPDLQDVTGAMDRAFARALDRPFERYARVRDGLEQKLHDFARRRAPTQEEAAELAAGLDELQQCRDQWQGVDLELDRLSMRYQRAVNGAVSSGLYREDQFPHRAGVSTLIRSVRADLGALAMNQGRRPAGWTEARHEQALAAWRDAAQAGVLQVASLPVWEGSQAEREHEALKQALKQAVRELQPQQAMLKPDDR